MNRIALGATALVVTRQIVAQWHGMAHAELGVGLATWQWAFVSSVIAAAPLVALVLYWTRLARFGALLLGISMLAGMLFGVYYHFVAVSPDNVNHLPAAHGRGAFVASAILLVPIELAAAIFSFWSWRKLGATAPSGD